MKWPQDLNRAMKLTTLITRGYSNITTNGRTDGAVYTRSNAATARLLSLVKPAETKHKRAMRNGDTKNHILSTSTAETSNPLGLWDMY